MIKARLVNSSSGMDYGTIQGYDGNPVMEVSTYGAFYGSFKSATRTGAGTTIIAQPDGDDAIVLTDLMLTTDKVNGATATVSWYDGTNTVTMISADVTDAPCNVAIAFSGHWQGWRSAYVQLVTTGNVSCTCALGYFKIDQDAALAYDEWNAKR